MAKESLILEGKQTSNVLKCVNIEKQRFVTYRSNKFLQKGKPIAEPSVICNMCNKFNRSVHPQCFL